MLKDTLPPSPGYARSVRPVTAKAIVTDTVGLVAGVVTFPTAGGPMPGYAAKPEGTGPFPVVLVVQEIFGVHDYIRDVCRRLAKLGYLAVAPELYFRQGDPSKIDDIQTLLATLVATVPDVQVRQDLDATLDWALEQGGDRKRVGITGFCWGGRQTWLFAAHSWRVSAAVAWYGRLEGAVNPNQRYHPIDVVADLKAPVLGLYGGADEGIPVDQVDRMRAACREKAKAAVKIMVYPDAPHAFHADYRPGYREEPARDGWEQMLSWFRTYGVA